MQKTITEIARFITEYQTKYPIKLMCKVLGINRSTYYKVANKVESARTLENQKLDAVILPPKDVMELQRFIMNCSTKDGMSALSEYKDECLSLAFTL